MGDRPGHLLGGASADDPVHALRQEGGGGGAGPGGWVRAEERRRAAGPDRLRRVPCHGGGLVRSGERGRGGTATQRDGGDGGLTRRTSEETRGSGQSCDNK